MGLLQFIAFLLMRGTGFCTGVITDWGGAVFREILVAQQSVLCVYRFFLCSAFSVGSIIIIQLFFSAGEVHRRFYNWLVTIHKWDNTSSVLQTLALVIGGPERQFYVLKYSFNSGYCEHDIDPFGCTEGGKILDCLFREDFAPSSHFIQAAATTHTFVIFCTFRFMLL